MLIPLNNLFGAIDDKPHTSPMMGEKPVIIKKKDGHQVDTENFSTLTYYSITSTPFQ